MASAKETVLRVYEQENIYVSEGGSDFSAMAELLHPDFVMRQPASLPFGGDWKGADGMQAWLKAFGEAWSEINIIKSEMFESDDVVVSKALVEAQARKTETRIQFELLQYIHVIDGKVAEMRPYYWNLPSIVSALNN